MVFLPMLGYPKSSAFLINMVIFEGIYNIDLFLRIHV